MKSHYAWMLCPLLLAYCEKPKSADAGSKQPPSVSMRSVRAEREGLSNSEETLRDAAGAPRRSQSRDDIEKESAALAWNAVETDFEHAGEMIRQLPADHPERMRLVLHYAMSLADRDPDEAIKWAASLGSELEIAAANGQIAVAIAESDPRRAASLLSDSAIAGHECDVAIVQVLQRWAAQSPADAAAWTTTFPAGAARKSGLGIIVSEWAKADSVAALTWMHTLRDETVRKEAALAMEMALLQQSPDVRGAWLQSADAKTRADLEAQHEQAMKEIGDNVSSTISSTEKPVNPQVEHGQGKP
jgi:hypothetical protein